MKSAGAGHCFQCKDYTFVQEPLGFYRPSSQQRSEDKTCSACLRVEICPRNWGYEHIPTKITVWADVLDLRTGVLAARSFSVACFVVVSPLCRRPLVVSFCIGEDAERDAGSVYYHYTNHLAYLNITNEAKETSH